MSRIRDFLRESIEAGAFPGAQYVIGGREGVLERGVLGTLDGTAPVAADSLYDLASITKIFVALSTMRLLEEGRLCLEDRVDAFLPEIDRVYPPRDGEQKGPITLFELLTHTSVLPAGTFYYKTCHSKAEMLEALRFLRPRDVAREGVLYTCNGYILLGEVLSAIDGRPLDAVIQARVQKPLGMERTLFNPPEALWENTAPTEFCRWRNKVVRGQVHDENAVIMGGVSGNAGLFSCADDVAKICAMMLCGGISGDGQRYLSRRSVEMMTQNYTQGRNLARGIGWQIKQGPGTQMGDLFTDGSYGHTGFAGTSLWVDPKQGLYTVLLTNRIHPSRENEQLFRCRRILNNLAVLEYGS